MRGSKAFRGAILRLKLAKGDSNEEEHKPDGEQDGARRILHGTQVLMYLLSPWYNTQSAACAIAILHPLELRKSSCEMDFDSMELSSNSTFSQSIFEQS